MNLVKLLLGKVQNVIKISLEYSSAILSFRKDYILEIQVTLIPLSIKLLAILI